MGKVKENFLQIQEDIEHYNVNIIAVTKYFGVDKMLEAYEAGLRDFGESKVKDALEKIAQVPEVIKNQSRFHLIGHLQSNKVKNAVGNFDFIHSVDSLKLAKAISQESKKQGLVQRVLLQVNVAEEEQKFGFSSKEIFEIFKEVLELENIQVVGLMTMAPLRAGERDLRGLFSDLAKIRDELEKIHNVALKELSMGMSGDYKLAVEAGATMVRIGKKLFS